MRYRKMSTKVLNTVTPRIRINPTPATAEYPSDEEHKPKSSTTHEDKDKTERRKTPQDLQARGRARREGRTRGIRSPLIPSLKDKQGSNGPERDPQDKPRPPPPQPPPAPQSQPPPEVTKSPEGGRSAGPCICHAEQDSDSERELVIDLGDENGGRDRKRLKKEPATSVAKAVKRPFGYQDGR